MKSLKMYGKAFREISTMNPRLLPALCLLSLFQATLPFINIYFSSEIITSLEAGKQVKQCVILISAALASNFVLFVFSNGLEQWYRKASSLMYLKENKAVIEKLYQVDYQKLEDSTFQRLIHLHQEAEGRVGSAFTQLAGMFRNFVSGTLTVAFSVWLLVPLFRVGLRKTGDRFLEKPAFFIVLVAAILLCVLAVLLLSRKLGRQTFEAYDLYARNNRLFQYYGKLLSDYKSGKEVRLFQEKDLIMEEATAQMLTEGEQIMAKVANASAKSSALVAIIGAVLGFGVYLFLGVKGLLGLFGIGSLIRYTGAFMQVVTGVTNIAVTLGKGDEIVPTLQYYFDILETPAVMEYGMDEARQEEVLIEFQNVSFRYPGTETPALKHVSFKIQRGEHLAVVGRNGSGKTTIIKLLCRFYDVDEGEIRINGIPVKEYSKSALNKLFSVVFQDFALFPFSVAENVASGDFDGARVLDSLEEAGLGDRVVRLPQGIHTPVYKELDKAGVEFSGGEAQKLALARALYKNAPVVILDEPTASLDPVAEYEIYKKFHRIVDGKSAIFISHKLSSCKFCERIAVLDQGELVQCGPHGELVKDENGVYAQLWQAQAGYYMCKD